MNVIKFKPTPKQKIAIEYLYDKTTEEILFGGGAGGGKSLLGTFWLIASCLQYPGSRWLLGRAKLKTLKETTLKTLFDIIGPGPLGIFKLRRNVDYSYNSMMGVISFYNGSEIVLKDLFLYPSDPEFDDLGSSEYTGAFVDEVSEVSVRAKEIVMSRLRYKTDLFGIIGKALFCTNPSKNWAYQEFYKPWRKNMLPPHRKFIQALVKDNPHIPKSYIENLKKRDKPTKQRLLFGNWEYDDDPAKLMEIDAIMDLFSNTFVPGAKDASDRYLVSDLAMQGRDRFIISYWEGLKCRFVLIKDRTSGKEIEEDLKAKAEEYGVPRSHILYDSGGMGQYLASYYAGIKEFNGSLQAPTKEEFRNLRAECYFKLAEKVNKREIHIECDDALIREEIISELEQIKRDKVDIDDVKKQIVKKEDIKEMLGRSPDFADVLMMRMYFEVAKWRVGTLSGADAFFG